MKGRGRDPGRPMITRVRAPVSPGSTPQFWAKVDNVGDELNAGSRGLSWMSRQCGRTCCTRLRDKPDAPLAREASRGVGLRFRLSHHGRAGARKRDRMPHHRRFTEGQSQKPGGPGEHLDRRKLAHWRLQQLHFWGVTAARRCQQTRSRARKTARGTWSYNKIDEKERGSGGSDPRRASPHGCGQAAEVRSRATATAIACAQRPGLRGRGDSQRSPAHA
jgi:hypothetical protein